MTDPSPIHNRQVLRTALYHPAILKALSLVTETYAANTARIEREDRGGAIMEFATRNSAELIRSAQLPYVASLRALSEMKREFYVAVWAQLDSDRALCGLEQTNEEIRAALDRQQAQQPAPTHLICVDRATGITRAPARCLNARRVGVGAGDCSAIQVLFACDGS